LAKPEQTFLTELKKSFIHYGAFFHKIADSLHHPAMKSRFDLPKPFDAIAAFAGTPIAIEAKVLRKYEAFGVRHLRPCQVEGLDWFAENGSSYVFLNIRHAGNKAEGIKRINRLYMFEWGDFKRREVIKKNEFDQFLYIDKKDGIFPIVDWLAFLDARRLGE